MSALTDRIISARDLMSAWAVDRDGVKLVRDALADAANAIQERDETIHAQRQRLAKVESFSSVELLNCARYVGEARNAIEGSDRGRELARMVLRLTSQASGEGE